MRQRATIAILAPLLGIILSGCETAPVIWKPTVPESLQSCADEPGAPDARTERDLVIFLEQVRVAGADCRGKLKALNEAVK